MSQLPNMDTVVEKYIETRAEISRLEAELESKLKPLKEFQAAREQFMLGLLTQAGCQNMKTQHGTAYILTKDSVTMGDWDAFKGWAIDAPLVKALEGVNITAASKDIVVRAFHENAHIEFLTHSVSKKAVQERLEEGETLPAGINYSTMKTVGIRKG